MTKAKIQPIQGMDEKVELPAETTPAILDEVKSCPILGRITVYKPQYKFYYQDNTAYDKNRRNNEVQKRLPIGYQC
jgi:hypothetical protein